MSMPFARSQVTERQRTTLTLICGSVILFGCNTSRTHPAQRTYPDSLTYISSDNSWRLSTSAIKPESIKVFTATPSGRTKGFLLPKLTNNALDNAPRRLAWTDSEGWSIHYAPVRFDGHMISALPPHSAIAVYFNPGPAVEGFVSQYSVIYENQIVMIDAPILPPPND